MPPSRERGRNHARRASLGAEPAYHRAATGRDGPRRAATGRDGPRRAATGRDGPRRAAAGRGWPMRRLPRSAWTRHRRDAKSPAITRTANARAVQPRRLSTAAHDTVPRSSAGGGVFVLADGARSYCGAMIAIDRRIPAVAKAVKGRSSRTGTGPSERRMVEAPRRAPGEDRPGAADRTDASRASR